jgi:hypothetical protein
MSKFKIAVWIIVLGLMGIILFQNDTIIYTQNDAIYLATHALRIDLYFVTYQSPKLPVAVYFLATLLIGLLIAHLSGLSERFKARKIIRSLTSTLDAQKEELSSLQREIEALKSRPPVPVSVSAVREEPPKGERNQVSQKDTGKTSSNKTGEAEIRPIGEAIPMTAEEPLQDPGKKDSGNEKETK